MIAERMRAVYEANRESWWERRFRRWEYCADSLMLKLAAAYIEADRELPPAIPVPYPTAEDMHNLMPSDYMDAMALAQRRNRGIV